jgi:hypothetical protein
MKNLKKQYELVCNEYIKRFCEKQEMDFEGWVGDQVGGIACCNEFFFNFQDIVLDINLEQPKEMIIDWYYENLETPEKSINYYSYTRGLRIYDVGGHFKKRQKEYKSNIVGHLGMRTIPMFSENAERSLKRMKDRTMTYIITGISNGKTFLMSDCVGTDNSESIKKFNYTKKLDKLISTNDETYFCLAGADSYGYAVNCFDRECYEKNKSFDFKNEEHILWIIDIFKKIKDYRKKHKINDFVRLYFITKTDIYYYQVDDNGNLSKLLNIGINNYYIRPNLTENSPIKLERQFENNQELIKFSKEEILKVQDYNIDLKDKYSFVIFDDKEVVFDNSVKTNKELVLSLIGGSYNELE